MSNTSEPARARLAKMRLEFSPAQFFSTLKKGAFLSANCFSMPA